MEYKGFGSGRILLADPIKLFDPRSIVTAMNPGVGGPELKFCQLPIVLNGTNVGPQLLDVDSINS